MKHMVIYTNRETGSVKDLGSFSPAEAYNLVATLTLILAEVGVTKNTASVDQYPLDAIEQATVDRWKAVNERIEELAR